MKATTKNIEGTELWQVEVDKAVIFQGTQEEAENMATNLNLVQEANNSTAPGATGNFMDKEAEAQLDEELQRRGYALIDAIHRLTTILGNEVAGAILREAAETINSDLQGEYGRNDRLGKGRKIDAFIDALWECGQITGPKHYEMMQENLRIALEEAEKPKTKSTPADEGAAAAREENKQIRQEAESQTLWLLKELDPEAGNMTLDMARKAAEENFYINDPRKEGIIDACHQNAADNNKKIFYVWTTPSGRDITMGAEDPEEALLYATAIICDKELKTEYSEEA